MKVAKFIIGNPASGKTTFIKKFKDELLVEDNYYIYDVNNYRYNTPLLNNDTIQKLAVLKAQDCAKTQIHLGKNLLIETTLRSFIETGLKTIQKLTNRGYSIELYILPPRLINDITRNSLRKCPTPNDRFVWYDDFETLFDGITKMPINYVQVIKVDFMEYGSIYDMIDVYYKSFSSEVDILTHLKVEGDVKLDINAIHFSSTLQNAKLYGDYIYEIKPLSKIYKYVNILYSKEIEIISKYTR